VAKRKREEMKKILVIEDNELLLKMNEFILKKNGFEVTTAKTGKEAIDALNTKSFNLIITDLMLPYANGFEIIDRIRQNKEQNHVPVIIISAVVNEETVMAGFESGADDYIKKPFTPGELLSRVMRLLNESVTT
jgi:DNA-binding response OmpR family regulator